MPSPKVSVLMAVYNAERYLRESIDSVLRQTFQDFELVIAYDPSTDESLSVINSYRDPRIRLIVGAQARGVTQARQVALQNARGEYVATLDADDTTRPDRLALQIDYLDRHPEVGVVGAAYELVDPAGTVLTTIMPPTDPLTIRWRLLFGNCLANSATMFRRHLALALGGYDIERYSGEDFDLWTRFAAHSTIIQLEQPLVCWRQHEGNLTKNESPVLRAHYAQIVARSVRMQTGRIIGDDVAAALFRDVPQPARDGKVLSQALDAITHCLRCLLAIPGLAPSQRSNLVSLALEEIFRVAHLNPGSYREACQSAIGCVVRHDWRRMRRKECVRLLAFALLPACAIACLSRLKQRFRAASSRVSA